MFQEGIKEKHSMCNQKIDVADTMISIIVPVFNGEKYLERLFQSLLDNDIQSFEVIVVNDGSSDRSQDIILNKSKQDNRVKYYYKENGGVSSTRNEGIKRATGRFIMFCDCDDAFSNNLINNLNNIVDNNIELIEFNRCEILGTSNKYMIESNMTEIISSRVYQESFFSCTRNSCFSVVNKIYLSRIIREHGIRFDEKLDVSEDLIFNIEYLQYVNTVKMVPYVSYLRFHNEGSLTFSGIDNYFNKNINILDEVSTIFYNEKVRMNLINHYAINAYDRMIFGYDGKNNKNRIIEIKNIKSYCKKNDVPIFCSSTKKYMALSVLSMLPASIFYSLARRIFR